MSHSEDPVDVTLALLVMVQNRIADVGLDALSPIERQVLALYDVWTQVQNGGFVQYMGNSASDAVHHALTGLTEVGGQHARQCIERAMATLGADWADLDHTVLIERIDAFDEDTWEALDDLADELFEGPIHFPTLIARRGTALLR